MPSLNTLSKRLLFSIGALLIFGLFFIYSSTIVHSQQVYGDPFRFVFLQSGWILVGGIGFWIFYNYPLDSLEKLAYIMFGVTLLFLIPLALFGILPCSINFPFIPCINESNRWFILNPSPLPAIPLVGELGFQPSELAKFALILYLSFKLPKLIKLKENIFSIYLSVTLLVSGLIVLQPNLSTSLIVFSLGTILYFSSGAPLKPLFYLIPLGIATALILTLISPYRRDRLITFISKGSAEENISSGYHINQVSIALGSGGLFGVGFGQSKQKYHLPEVSSDSIFAIIGEELGFLGAFLLITLFTFYFYNGLQLSLQCKESSHKLISIGIVSWICLQFFFHVCANTGLIPYTGVPVPLVSYGGSSMLFGLMAQGLLLNLSKSNCFNL